MTTGKFGASLGARLLHAGASGTRRHRRHRRAAAICLAVGLVAALAATSTPGATATVRPSHRVAGDMGGRTAFHQVNLVSDVPGMAKMLDKEIKNPWGIALGPDTPLWVNNNFNPASDCGNNCVPDPQDLLTKITIYAGVNGKAPISRIPLEVTASSPTGMVFNPSSDFVIKKDETRTPARFLFNETFVDPSGQAPEGKITGWSNLPSPVTHTTSTTAVNDPGCPYGRALVPPRGDRGRRLLVADGISGGVAVYNSHFKPVGKPGMFVDDPMAAKLGLGAYNVMFLRGRVYVAYFANNGEAVSKFRQNGTFIKRLVSGKPLAVPWGMAIAPDHWGHLGGSLLVGNVDNGKINAFNRHNGNHRGVIRDAQGKAFVNPGLWGLAFGNGVIGTPRTLLFAAGVGSEVGGFGRDIYERGLVGLIRPVMRN